MTHISSSRLLPNPPRAYPRAFSFGAIVGLLVALNLVTGCARHHSIPPYGTRLWSAPTFRVVLDQDGYVYPATTNESRILYPWRESEPNILDSLGRTWAFPIRGELRKHGHSYDPLAVAGSTAQAISTILAESERLFIFIHGFNESFEEADASYNVLESAVCQYLTERDVAGRTVFVRLFWDGMYTSIRFLGTKRQWNEACGFSQLAGINGLRAILREVGANAACANKPIFIITHSRGAAVALSAFANPPFTKKFIKDTEKGKNRVPIRALCDDRFPVLPDVRLGLLAPAVGSDLFYGFWSTNLAQPKGTASTWSNKWSNAGSGAYQTNNPLPHHLPSRVVVGFNAYDDALRKSYRLCRVNIRGRGMIPNSTDFGCVPDTYTNVVHNLTNLTASAHTTVLMENYSLIPAKNGGAAKLRENRCHDFTNYVDLDQRRFFFRFLDKLHAAGGPR